MYKKYNTVYNEALMTEQDDLCQFNCANTLFKLQTVKQGVVYWQDVPFGHKNYTIPHTASKS